MFFKVFELLFLCFYCPVFVVVKTSTYKVNTMHFSSAFLISLSDL